MNKAINQINHYPVDKSNPAESMVCSDNTYPLYSDLFGGQPNNPGTVQNCPLNSIKASLNYIYVLSQNEIPGLKCNFFCPLTQLFMHHE